MSVSRLELRIFAAKRAGLGAAGMSLALGLAGCATQIAQTHYSHGHEYFSQAKYGHASAKVVADGEPVPRGGGQYLVGRPYTIAGHTYYPAETTSYSAVGMASWYGAAFHGRRTANGEVYDMASYTAAHPTMPLPSYARVTNLANGYSIIVRVNDRGPYHGGRVMDVSSRTAEVLDFKSAGTARIKVEYVGPAPLEGSDDPTLLASLRTDGSPASINGYPAPVMVASASRQDSTPPPPLQSPFQPFWTANRSAPIPAPRPTPEPEPAPIPVAAEPTPEPETRAEVAVRQPRGPVPVPPSRPFDLGSDRSANLTVAVSIAQPAHIVTPPRRPELHASAEKALYLVNPAARWIKLPARAFDRLNIPKSVSADD
jgi:rare lipoprotein A